MGLAYRVAPTRVVDPPQDFGGEVIFELPPQRSPGWGGTSQKILLPPQRNRLPPQNHHENLAKTLKKWLPPQENGCLGGKVPPQTSQKWGVKFPPDLPEMGGNLPDFCYFPPNLGGGCQTLGCCKIVLKRLC